MHKKLIFLPIKSQEFGPNLEICSATMLQMKKTLIDIIVKVDLTNNGVLETCRRYYYNGEASTSYLGIKQSLLLPAPPC